MTVALHVHRIGHSVTIQDLGRPGNMVFGLSPGGAADRYAFSDGAALLNQCLDCSALEMAGYGGEFEATADIRIALTGAPMQAHLDGSPLVWNASHSIAAGQRLVIGTAISGVYGYLHVGGGIATQPFLGSRATHLASGIGRAIASQERLPVGADTNPDGVGQKLPSNDRYSGGTLRVLPSVQTDRFSSEAKHRFESTSFTRTLRGNRQGAELQFEGEPFTSDGQLTILSETMVAGDIQMTGAGEPFVLLPECQTTGGYPRIGTILPDDLPLVAQAVPGVDLKFKFLTHEQALAFHRPIEKYWADQSRQLQPLLRDPRDIRDLLGYQLISGAITGWE
jgi:biotin-dependent carboxylase-like uncharacterized protein